MTSYGVTDKVGFLLLESDEELREYLTENYSIGKIAQIMEWVESDLPILQISNDHDELETWGRY